jgi:hypothetical protein
MYRNISHNDRKDLLNLFSVIIIPKDIGEMQGNASGSIKRSFLNFLLFFFSNYRDKYEKMHPNTCVSHWG